MVAVGVGEHLLDLSETIYNVYFEDFYMSDRRLGDLGLLLHVRKESGRIVGDV